MQNKCCKCVQVMVRQCLHLLSFKFKIHPHTRFQHYGSISTFTNFGVIHYPRKTELPSSQPAASTGAAPRSWISSDKAQRWWACLGRRSSHSSLCSASPWLQNFTFGSDDRCKTCHMFTTTMRHFCHVTSSYHKCAWAARCGTDKLRQLKFNPPVCFLRFYH